MILAFIEKVSIRVYATSRKLKMLKFGQRLLTHDEEDVIIILLTKCNIQHSVKVSGYKVIRM